MSGYCDYSKSNNAMDAEQENKYPASIAAEKLGVLTEAIKNILEPSEWHHTSCYYNETDYYDISIYLLLKDDQDITEYCYNQEEEQEYYNNWLELQNYKPIQNESIYNADIIITEWIGRYKNYKRPVKTEYNNVNVLEKGCFYYITTESGEQFKKKINSNGIEIVRVY